MADGRVRDVPRLRSETPEEPPAELPAGVAGGVAEPEVEMEAPGSVRSDSEVTAAVEAYEEFVEQPREELVDQRSATQRVFQRTDGTTEVELSATPLHYESQHGVWTPIDTTVRPSTDNGSARAQEAPAFESAANSWTAQFDPVASGTGGLRIETAAGSFQVTPREATAAVPSKDEDDGSRVRYEAVWPETDLDYAVQATGVKEDIVLRSAEAPSRFAFDVVGAKLATDGTGGLSVSGPAGDFRAPAPTVVDAQGADVTVAAGAAFEVSGEGSVVTVVVNPDWLRGLAAESFPVRIDPTYEHVRSTTFQQSWRTDGVTSSAIKVGRDAAGLDWRAQIAFDYSAFLNYPQALVGAYLTLDRYPEQVNQGERGHAALYSPTASSFAGTMGTPFWNGDEIHVVDNGQRYLWDDVPGAPDLGLQATIQSWLDRDLADQRIGIAADQVIFPSHRGSLHDHTATLRLVFQDPPPASTLLTPADGAVLNTRTPTLTATQVTFDDQFPVNYRFDISTGSGTAVSSGWMTGRTWTVPHGALKDGVDYVASVSTASRWMIAVDLPGQTSAASVKLFRLNMGLGQGDAQPTDSAGAVPGVTGELSEGSPAPSTSGAAFKTNMINGNLAVSVSTHSVAATSGAIAPTLIHNSMADRRQSGLAGTYYSDIDRDRVFDATDIVRTQRLDPLINASWNFEQSEMVAGMPRTDQALVRWTGFIRMPSTSSTWQFGLDLDGNTSGARVYLGSEPTPVIDQWAPVVNWRPAVFGGNRSMTANVWVPIRVEYWSAVRGGVRLLARNGGTTYVVDTGWLSPEAPALPQGWQLSTGLGANVDVARVEDLGDVVVVRRSDGSSVGFRRLTAGGYAPPHGSHDNLTVDRTGRLNLATESGLLYQFRPDGQIDRVTTAADDLQPAAFEYTYGGTPVRLQSIRDPLANRQVTFSYGGCGSGSTAMLCRITFWDGKVTQLTYSNGLLVRVSNPGYQTASGQTQPTLFDFAYNGAGWITAVRDPLAADLVAYNQRQDNDELHTLFDYFINGRLYIMRPPLLAAGDETRRTVYNYDLPNRTTTVNVEGFGPIARRVRWDAEGNRTEDTDAAGLTTTYAWEDHRLVAETKPGGIRTTHAYDRLGDRTDTWGPAPAADFGADNRPLPGKNVPHATTSYDDGMVGLAAAYWPNPNLSGSPTRHGSSVGLVGSWPTPPVAPDSQGRWSMRLTGLMYFEPGWTFIHEDQGTGVVRMWVDDRLAVESGSFGAVNQPGTEGGWKRVRLEYINDNPGDVLSIKWYNEANGPNGSRPAG